MILLGVQRATPGTVTHLEISHLRAQRCLLRVQATKTKFMQTVLSLFPVSSPRDGPNRVFLLRRARKTSGLRVRLVRL